MDRGLSLLSSINKVLWGKRTKEEDTNSHDVQVEDISLEGVDKSESEYWTRLTDHTKRRRMGSTESASDSLQNEGLNVSMQEVVNVVSPLAIKDGEAYRSPQTNAGPCLEDIQLHNSLHHVNAPSCSNPIPSLIADPLLNEAKQDELPYKPIMLTHPCNTVDVKTETGDNILRIKSSDYSSGTNQENVQNLVPHNEKKINERDADECDGMMKKKIGSDDPAIGVSQKAIFSSKPVVNSKDSLLNIKNEEFTCDIKPNVNEVSKRDNTMLEVMEATSHSAMASGVAEVEITTFDPHEKQKITEFSHKHDESVDLSPNFKLEKEKVTESTVIGGQKKKDSSKQKAVAERKMSEGVRSRRTSSGTMSPDMDSRRGSGAVSPVSTLAFNSIQDKILALSRENSTVEVKKKVPKVNKLDDKILAVVKNNESTNLRQKPEEVAKKMPKIDTNLKSKILKFGAPSLGAKIPVKKVEPVQLEKSIIGGYAIKGEELTTVGTPKLKKKVKPKAPQPPTNHVDSLPSTENKLKRLKGKAPLPPDMEGIDNKSVGKTDNSVATDNQSVERVPLHFTASSSGVVEQQGISKSLREDGLDVSDKKVSSTKLIKSVESNSSQTNVINISNISHKSPDLAQNEVSDNKIRKLSPAKHVELIKSNNSQTDINNTSIAFGETIIPKHEVAVIKDRKASPQNLSEMTVTQDDHSRVTQTRRLDDNSVTVKNEKSALLQREKTSVKLVNEDKSSVPSLVIPDIVTETNIPDEMKDLVDGDKTPIPSRRQLSVNNVSIERNSHSMTPEIWTDSTRKSEDKNLLSRSWRDSSDSESFHTPSPRPEQFYTCLTFEEPPVMYSSKGEVIGDHRLPALTPLQMSPERELFTPEGSPLSDFSDDSYDHYIASVDFSVRPSSVPRRALPQNHRPRSYHEDWKEDSPVVFDARLSFDLAARATPVRQLFSPLPAHTEPRTVSNSLSCKIAEFLSRTDHIMDEWKKLGRGDSHDIQSLVELPNRRLGSAKRSQSAANIMIKGFQYYSRGSSKGSWRSPSISRYSEASDRTLADLDELNEMTADLAEERGSGSQTAERLEAETAERIRLEQELSQVSDRKSKLEQTMEQMELELYYAKHEVNGLSESETDWEDGRDGGVYKEKCARLMREIQMLRSRLQQQHEDDLEQLVGLKKQLEKKLADAYEEVDEQRQIVAQWKRKSQKLQAEMNDLRLILEEQNSRNNLLEKKQRKFDNEIQMLQDELRSEKNIRDRVSREKDVAVGQKYSLEQSLSSVRLELELKEEKLGGLSRELEELSIGGATEQDISQLRKMKHDLEIKTKDQDDELDDLAGQVSMLESAKLKLEMSLESLKKEHRKEIAQKEEEIEEVRSKAMKKLKALESSLEQEHEDRSLLLREKHELERRLKEQEERGRNNRAAEEDTLLRLRKDLRKTKALLRDAHVMLDRAKQDSPSKATIRAIKNQLEDCEFARAAAVKAKQSIEAELNEANNLLEEASKSKSDAESRAQAASRQSSTLRSQLEENEEELSELMKKYRQAVQHLTQEQSKNQEVLSSFSEVEAERNSLREQLAEITARLEAAASVDPTSDLNQRRLEARIKDLESRLELEATVRTRLETQISRLKEKLERVTEESNQYRAKEQAAADQVRKIQRSLRESKEELALHVAREQEANLKRRELEKRLEVAEQETSSAKNDLRLSIQRVQDLQHALSAEISSDSDMSSDTEIIEDSGLLSAESCGK